jgi:hypothetical protein
MQFCLDHEELRESLKRDEYSRIHGKIQTYPLPEFGIVGSLNL